MSAATSRALTDWCFTQTGGGKGTEDGEWLQVSSFPTTVHVELLKLQKIPDPVSNVAIESLLPITEPFDPCPLSLLAFTNGTYNVGCRMYLAIT